MVVGGGGGEVLEKFPGVNYQVAAVAMSTFSCYAFYFNRCSEKELDKGENGKGKRFPTII